MTAYRYPIDLQYFAGEKTEKATPHKREESRKKGQVFKSTDLSTAISLLAFFLYFRVAGGAIGEKLTGMIADYYNNRLTMSVSENNVHRLFTDLAFQSLSLIAPFLIVALVVGAGSQLFQVGFLFHPEQIMFKAERIDPLKGLKRIYSLRAIIELLKSILKIAVIGTVAFSMIWINRSAVIQSVNQSIGGGLQTMARIVLNMGMAASLALIALSLIDYIYQKYDYEKNIRMSRQDIKDEFKNMEGDPQIKSRIKQRQKQMAMRRMMQELPKADVVITNPTHFAVALQYDSKKMTAPVVIAKGADYLALKIREIARKHGIVIVEKKPLARALYHQLDIGDSVPEDFFKAVAELLAYVYRIKGKHDFGGKR
ncbi:flagellar biosynthesis protein FlhB [Sporolactobacillus sp. THM7-4]|nr:flagellar biosynthesis protein FlhB [Sporolactobacillus sp. THM7-4]